MRRVLTLAAAAVTLAAGPAWPEAHPVRGEDIGDFPRSRTIHVMVGDVDAFHPGDALDDPILSADCCEILCYCETQPGMCGRQRLDEHGDDRPVGLTIPFYVPSGSRIVSAELTLAFLGVSASACNDHILIAPEQYPAIALADLLGCEPQPSRAYVADVDLRNVPIRTCGAPGHDDSWCGPPDAFLNLVATLEHEGRLDLAFTDDVVVDYALLRVVWEPLLPAPAAGGVPVLIAPNPAVGGDVTISFSLSRSVLATVEVFDVTGRRVATPASGVTMGPGPLRVVWNGRTDAGTRTPPGTYFVRLSCGEGEGVAKLLRIR
jgi:hypothetical protein